MSHKMEQHEAQMVPKEVNKGGFEQGCGQKHLGALLVLPLEPLGAPFGALLAPTGSPQAPHRDFWDHLRSAFGFLIFFGPQGGSPGALDSHKSSFWESQNYARRPRREAHLAASPPQSHFFKGPWRSRNFEIPACFLQRTLPQTPRARVTQKGGLEGHIKHINTKHTHTLKTTLGE